MPSKSRPKLPTMPTAESKIAAKTDSAAESRSLLAASGGKARASKLSPERRKEIAATASAARWRAGAVIKATHAGTFTIGDTELVCANLPDGRRLLAESTVMNALGRGYSGYYSQRDAASESGAIVPRFVSPAYLQPHIPEELVTMLANPIWYVAPRKDATAEPGETRNPRAPAKGIDAEALPLVCEAWLRAREAGALEKNEPALKTAKLAELLIRGLARVGIAAMIDEATGAQADRNKLALQAIFDRFLVRELADWAKRFPDEFYEQIFRLRGWAWKGRNVNPPQVVASYTKDLVYARLGPGLLKEMQSLAAEHPKSHRLHQWLSKDGQDALQAHFHKLIALQKASTSWDQMKGMVDVVLPKQDDTLSLPFMASPPNAVSDPNDP